MHALSSVIGNAAARLQRLFPSKESALSKKTPTTSQNGTRRKKRKRGDSDTEEEEAEEESLEDLIARHKANYPFHFTPGILSVEDIVEGLELQTREQSRSALQEERQYDDDDDDEREGEEEEAIDGEAEEDAEPTLDDEEED
jgi:hypothetical protein